MWLKVRFLPIKMQRKNDLLLGSEGSEFLEDTTKTSQNSGLGSRIYTYSVTSVSEKRM